MTIKTGISWATPGLAKGIEWTAYSHNVLIAKVEPSHRSGTPWYWHSHLPLAFSGDQNSGYTKTADAAKAQIEKLWLAWLAAAGLHNETATEAQRQRKLDEPI